MRQIVKKLMGKKSDKFTPIIRNFKHARLMEDAYMAQWDEESYALLKDVPPTEQEYIKLVQEIDEAMMHSETAVDAFKPSTKKENTVEPTAAFEFIKSLGDIEKQIIAWRLLSTTLNAQAGKYAIPTWAKSKFKPAQYDSFRERFDDVLETLRTSKALTKNLFDSEPTWIKRIAMNPEKEHGRKSQNLKTNKKRDIQVKFANKHMSEEDLQKNQLPKPKTSTKRQATEEATEAIEATQATQATEASIDPMTPAKRLRTQYGTATPTISPDTTWPNATWPNTTWPNTTWPNTTWPNATWPNTTSSNTISPNTSFGSSMPGSTFTPQPQLPSSSQGDHTPASSLPSGHDSSLNLQGPAAQPQTNHSFNNGDFSFFNGDFSNGDFSSGDFSNSTYNVEQGTTSMAQPETLPTSSSTWPPTSSQPILPNQASSSGLIQGLDSTQMFPTETQQVNTNGEAPQNTDTPDADAILDGLLGSVPSDYGKLYDPNS